MAVLSQQGIFRLDDAFFSTDDLVAIVELEDFHCYSLSAESIGSKRTMLNLLNWVMLVTVLALILFFVVTINVGRARFKSGIKAPQMSGDPELNWVMLVTVLALILFFVVTINVGRARFKSGIKAPQMSGGESSTKYVRTIGVVFTRAVDFCASR